MSLRVVKRPFEDPPATSTSSAETSNKRARSTSSDASASTPASSAYTTASSDICPDATTAPDGPPPPFMSDFHLPIPPPPPPPQRTHVPTPPAPEDALRTSLQRFADFDRQIAALRTSLATRSPPLAPAVDAPSDHWRPDPSPFATSPPNHDALHVSSSTASGAFPSASFPPTFGNAPRYRPPSRGSPSLAVHDRGADAALMRPSPNENFTRPGARPAIPHSGPHLRPTRRSLSPLVFPSDPSSSSLRPSADTGDVLLRYRTLAGDLDAPDSRPQRRGFSSPVPSLDREIAPSRRDLTDPPPGLSPQSHHVRVIREHSAERAPVRSAFDLFNFGESSQDRDRPSTIREPPPSRYALVAEPVPPRVPAHHHERPRGPAPTTTALGISPVPAQDLHTRHHASSWTSIPSSNSLMSESASEQQHALALERFRTRLRRSSFDDDELESRWSASSRGGREHGHDLGVVSPMPPSPSLESVPATTTSSHFPPPPTNTRAEPATSTSSSLQRSFSDLFAEVPRTGNEGGADDWLVDWEAPRAPERDRRQRERQRERVWEWERERERQRERPGEDVRGRDFASGLSLASTSSTREELSHPPLPPPSVSTRQPGPAANATAMTTAPNNNGLPYSYSNLNLSSFQSGLFRDSLRRNAEVDQASFPSNRPVVISVTPAVSRDASRLGLEDSGSDMDMDADDAEERRLRHAGDTPGHTPSDESPPHSLSSLPAFSVLRRASVVDAPSRPHPNRNSTVFTRPIPPPTRAGPYENNTHRPAPPERAERDRFLPARILESFYRSHEDGRRNGPTTPGLGPYTAIHPHAPLAAPVPSSGAARQEGASVSPPRGGNGHEHGRRGSLSLGGSIRSRLARFAQSASSSVNGEVPSTAASRQRSPPHPIGARPQVAEPRVPARRSSLSVFGGAHGVEQDRSAPPWVMMQPAPGSVETMREVPWRAPSSGRAGFTPVPAPASESRRERAEVPTGTRTEEQRSRLRSLRQRLQLDRGEGMRVFRPGMLRAAIGRRGNFGDYVPDELFDDSYEALLSLSSMLGEVRSRATPEEVIASLPTGTFREWKRADSETRCPICLDDYEPLDVLTKLIECTHWLHKDCLEQWLRTANTCPVCREKVKASPKPAPARRRPTREVPRPSEMPPAATTTTMSPSNRLQGRPPHAGPQTNQGRPVSFATMVFDRLMPDGREVPEPWTGWSSSPPPPPLPPLPPARERGMRVPLSHPAYPPTHAHDVPDVYVPFPPPPPVDGPFYAPSRVTGANPAGSRSATGERALGFASLLRGQASDPSMTGTNGTGSHMVVDEGQAPRRGAGTTLLEPPPVVPMPRREPGVVPPSTSLEFSGQTMGSGVPNGRPWAREWRGGTVHVDGSRSSSSASSSSSSSSMGNVRPMGMANRIPVDEDGPIDEYMFGWNVRRRAGSGAGA